MKGTVRLYRVLLSIYPQSFRREFGAQLEQVFRTVIKDQFQKHGNVGYITVWMRVLPDFGFSLIELYTSRQGGYMGWQFRLRWIVACGVGASLGDMILLSLLMGRFMFPAFLGTPAGLFNMAIYAAVVGLLIGLFQSRLLGKSIDTLRWAIFTSIGLMIGSEVLPVLLKPGTTQANAVPTALFLGMAAAFPGIGMGIMQSFLLRARPAQRRTWALASGFGTLAGLLIVAAIGDFARTGFLNLNAPLQSVFHAFVGGCTLGFLTSNPLDSILRNRSVPTDSNPSEFRPSEV